MEDGARPGGRLVTERVAEKRQISQRGDCFTPTLVLNAPRLSHTLGKLNWDPDESSESLCRILMRNVLQESNCVSW